MQRIGYSPLYVLYCNEHAIRLWHELNKKQPAFIDATDGVVYNKKKGREYLYYEICFANPTPGLTSIPVAAMLSEKHDVPQIHHFLSCFQHSEKQVYGRSNTSQPQQINTDFSMALILSVLKCYNTETLNDYLDRTWKILSGHGTNNDLKKTVLHVCLAHVMKNVKSKLKDHLSKRNLEFCMYFFGLLINAKY